MNRTLLLTILCLLTFSDAVYPQLKLEKKIVGQYYCPGDNDLDGLSLNLKLKYTNESSQPIILAKDGLGIGQMIVMKNYNGAVGIREMNAVYTLISSSEWTANERDLKRLFVTLKPGETYETKIAARVLVLRENRSEIAGAVEDGKHFLQLRISTWSGSKENADRLRESWKERGKLWTNSVLSEPMPFIVVPRRRLVKCR